ncbi:MAG: M23 family metallopeptidase [Elusimicrobia bacterium]|nr:M23 family metallopeptidase [Elusimicrobiota bacterium]
MRWLLLASLFGASAWAASGNDDFARYVREAKRFKQQKDSGELDDKPVISVLKKNGLLDVASDGSFRTGFRPFQVRVYNGLWRWPLKAGIVSSEFGRRWGRRHLGIDIAADQGVAVFACAPGRVLFSGESKGGYGNVVILRHDQATTSLYAHNSELLVKEGDVVQAGQTIAKLGSTGRSTGPHIHLEIRMRDKALDPRKRLVRSRF